LDLASSRINLGIKYFEDCQWAEALRNFEEAAQLNDQYPDAFYWIALSHIQLKNESKAKENLEKALELNPKYADAHFQIGMLLKNKAKKKARNHLKESLELHLRESFAKVARKILNE
jgi:Tfp pilus assembly protein PilF